MYGVLLEHVEIMEIQIKKSTVINKLVINLIVMCNNVRTEVRVYGDKYIRRVRRFNPGMFIDIFASPNIYTGPMLGLNKKPVVIEKEGVQEFVKITKVSFVLADYKLYPKFMVVK